MPTNGYYELANWPIDRIHKWIHKYLPKNKIQSIISNAFFSENQTN